ncbi:hypothetical protein RR46_11173 [Papilio xuthus]|uniref:BBSome-interacting protein 1 n=1 Tax=Papilio xuthus TaxID=66420 RepID=A0A194PXJ9_PAPXU|nr:hypothetical protein RR46_11173 [Papilio xuthus]
MSEKSEEINTIEFDPILPDCGILFFEECPTEYEIQRPILLPLKSTTQLRFEQLQQEAARLRRDSNKSAKQTP